MTIFSRIIKSHSKSSHFNKNEISAIGGGVGTECKGDEEGGGVLDFD